MALKARSLILYGMEVDETNQSLDFKIAAMGPTLEATLRTGYYSLSSLCTEIVRALTEADSTNTYTCTADRTIAGGTSNRVTIATSGGFLQLLFLSGPRSTSTVATLIGFLVVDYTGSTSYTGSSAAGTPLIPDQIGYDYKDKRHQPKLFGAVNKSASGLKQAVVFQIQRFIDVRFQWEPETKVNTEWVPFIEWAIQQRPFDFTPEVTSPNTFYEVTLDSTPRDGKGLGFDMREMKDQVPEFYDTGKLVFMLTPQVGG